MLSHEGVSEGRRGTRASTPVTRACMVRMIRMVARMIRASGVWMIRAAIRMIRLRRAGFGCLRAHYPDHPGGGPDRPGSVRIIRAAVRIVRPVWSLALFLSVFTYVFRFRFSLLPSFFTVNSLVPEYA